MKKPVKETQSEKGNFFAIDWRTWARVCDLGMNPSVAYLVLARFSQRDNRKTAASSNAIETHTGISRGRAFKAIHALIQKGFMLQTAFGTRPKYELLAAEEVPRVCASEKSGRSGASGRTEGPQWIWLPNEIVSGAVYETPPVELLRQRQDQILLRLFVDLYHMQNLVEDGGIDRRYFGQEYEKRRVGQQGPFTIWGFYPGNQYENWGDFATLHVRKNSTDQQKGHEDHSEADFSQRLDLLLKFGLVEMIPHLFESSAEDAEIIHPYEGELADCAHQAAESMMYDLEKRFELFSDDGFLMVPVPHHVAQVEMCGILRLRYRPKTRMTAAWFAEREQKFARYIQLYNGIPERVASIQDCY